MVRRFATSAEANLKVNREDRLIHVDFVETDGQPAAVGIELEVDAIKFEIDRNKLSRSLKLLGKEEIAQLKYQFVKDKFFQNTELPDDFNSFQREWLFQFLTTFIAEKIYSNELNTSELSKNNYFILKAELCIIANAWFIDPALSAEIIAHSDPVDPEGRTSVSTREQVTLQDVLIQRIENNDICAALHTSVLSFVNSVDDNFDRWLLDGLIATLGEVFLQSCIVTLPNEATTDDLIVDTDLTHEDSVIYWVSETTLGGAGVVESFAYNVADSPNKLFDNLESVITPSESELIDEALTQIVKFSQIDDDLKQIMYDLRNVTSLRSRQVHWSKFTEHFNKLSNRYIGKATAVSINSRLLRPGSNSNLDLLYHRLLAFRATLETKCNFVIPNREFAYIASKEQDFSLLIENYLKSYLSPQEIQNVSFIATIESLIWVRSFDVRKTELQSYNPFKKIQFVDPILIRLLGAEKYIKEIMFSDPKFENIASDELRTKGIVKILFDLGDTDRFQSEIMRFLATPVDIDIFQFYPSIDGVEQKELMFHVTIILREQIS